MPRPSTFSGQEDTVLSLSTDPTLGPKGISGSHRDPGAAGSTTEGFAALTEPRAHWLPVSSPGSGEKGLVQLPELLWGVALPPGPRASTPLTFLSLRDPCLLFLTILPAYLSLQ